ncbi:MAG: ribonuclease P subunit P30 [Methanobrevibacter sp.]|jgi:ribonuclease P/MRP protein subunit RPP1|nr:ribonuclease P subunit P30 [Methanobrevibacter sp.]
MDFYDLFYDLNIKGNHFQSDLAIIKEAIRLNWNHLTLRYSPEKFKDLNYKKELIENIENMEEIAIPKDFSIGFGLEINVKKSNDIRNNINKFKKDADLFSVLGGNPKINRMACESLQVDILSRPYFRRYDSGINQVLAKEALKNNVAIELCIKDILTTYLSHRAKVIANFRDIIKLYRKFKFPLIISSGASSIFDIRHPRDIIAIFKEIGLKEEEIQDCFNSYPRNIIDFNKERENIIVVGAKVIKK